MTTQHVPLGQSVCGPSELSKSMSVWRRTTWQEVSDESPWDAADACAATFSPRGSPWQASRASRGRNKGVRQCLMGEVLGESSPKSTRVCRGRSWYRRRPGGRSTMDLGIGGRVALVTGASSGIGEAVAMALAAEGVKLAVAARRTDLLDAIASRAKASGAADARGFAVDLAHPDAVARMVEAVRAAFGDIDILVLNGGGPKPG